jgi:ADP-ribosylglycohydrolase
MMSTEPTAVQSARQALDRSASYADAVRHAVSLGQDTDTTAAVAGGIAGIRYGLYGIPLSWRERLRGKDLLQDLQTGLIRHASIREGHGGDTFRTKYSSAPG